MFSAEAVCWRRCQTFSFVFGEFKRKNQDSVCREIGNPVRNRKIGTLPNISFHVLLNDGAKHFLYVFS